MEEGSVEELLNKWCLRVKRSQFAHRFAAKEFSRLHLLLGLSTVLIAAMTGTAIFASFEKDLPNYGKILAGILSLLAALLSALQTFLRLDEKSEKHQRADANYSAVRQEIEQHQAIQNGMSEKQEKIQDFLDTIRGKMDALAKDSPIAPEKHWQKARSLLTPYIPQVDRELKA